MDGRVIVIGGGAAGMMAAGSAALLGARVILLEKTEQLGNKILISGKNRCNVTNSAPILEFLRAYGDNGKWLRNVFDRFFREELLAFFAEYSVPCKEERGGRIFPSADDAAVINHALQRHLVQNGVKVITDCAAREIIVNNERVSAVVANGEIFPAAAVVLATGGSSYPQTGSSGDGYRMAKMLGHTLITPTPALVPLVVKEMALVKVLQGVSLKNVRLSAFACASEAIDTSLIPSFAVGRGTDKRAKPPLIESRFGEMLFTHFGIGGPITLLISLAVNRALLLGKVSVSIDLKPAISLEQLSRRLQRDFDTHGKRQLAGILMGLLPRQMAEPVAALSGVAADKKACAISAGERAVIAETLKSLRFNITGSLPLSRAIVTAGGVALSEVCPHTLESRLAKGLFLCGEVLDIDADTGGYNLQAAFSTGFVAGAAAALRADIKQPAHALG